MTKTKDLSLAAFVTPLPLWSQGSTLPLALKVTTLKVSAQDKSCQRDDSVTQLGSQKLFVKKWSIPESQSASGSERISSRKRVFYR